MLPALETENLHALPSQACMLDRMHGNAATTWRFYNPEVDTDPGVHELL